MAGQLHVVILEDNRSDAELVERELRKAGFAFKVQFAQDKRAFLHALDEHDPDLILADYSLPGFDGLAAMSLARARFPEVPVVIVSGAIGEETAIDALKAGATDYVLKQRLSRLGPVVKRALLEAEQLAEKRQAEEALREAHVELEMRVQERTRELEKAMETVTAERQRLFDVLETMPAMICLLTPDYHVAFANRSFREKFGQSDGRHCYEYCYGRSEPCEFCESLHVLRTGKPHQWEVIAQDGSVIAAHDIPFTDADGSRLILEMNLDITEVRRAQTVLKEANEALEQRVVERTAALVEAKAAAEAANEAKSRFLANMSHELRTPMNAILGMVELAARKSSDPTARDFLETAKASADLLLALLNDLLDTAKIESGKLELEAAPFSLRRILDSTTQVLAVRASEKGISYCCRIAPEVPDRLVGDQFRLRQVLLNLAGNGIKFTEQGDVAVNVQVEMQSAEEASLEFAVRDTGIGVPRSELEHVFQPFTQADRSTARRFGGTGLGLAICSNLVGMMGGRIWAESELGQGSTFHFTVRLPLASELPQEPKVREVQPIAASVLRILVVEDNPANQKFAGYVLKDRGHAVDFAGDGQQALKMTEQNHYDVVLMDVEMPGMNGLETTAAIRTRGVGEGRVPIIAMTAHAMKGDRERCLAAGMDGYLCKPVDGREMIALVESLAAGAATPCPSPEIAVSSTSPVFDLQLAAKRCLNKQEMLDAMVQYFFDDFHRLMPEIHTALGKGDLVEVGRLGHRLKGTVTYLGADPAAKAAGRVERLMLHDGEQTEAEAAVQALEHECKRLAEVLSKRSSSISPATTHSPGG